MVIVENSMFYKYISKISEDHTNKYPEDLDKVEKYLAQIKSLLNI